MGCSVAGGQSGGDYSVSGLQGGGGWRSMLHLHDQEHGGKAQWVENV